MARHTFQFEGGDDLTTMGASWFVSYAYYCNVDQKHTNWKMLSTFQRRISVFNRTINLNQFWLEQIANKKDENLNRNTLGVTAGDIKNMAKTLLKGNKND